MPKDVGSPNIRELATKAVDDAYGDWERAIKIFRGWVDEDQTLRDALLEPFLDGGIRLAIREAAKRRRKQIDAEPPASTEGLEEMAHTYAQNYFEYPLSKGVKLGDATIEILTFERDMHATFAAANFLKSRRFQLLIDLMTKTWAKKDVIVRDVITHDDLVKLWTEA